MELELTATEQNLLNLLLELPPGFEDAKNLLQTEQLPADSITKVGIEYANACFLDYDEGFDKKQMPRGIAQGRHSTYLTDVIKLLLEHGLNPNAVYCFDGLNEYNIMDKILFVDNEYVAADTLALLLENGGNPNLRVGGNTIYDDVEFSIWFGSNNQEIRWRYDAKVHIWMVLLAYGGKFSQKDEEEPVKVFKAYNSEWSCKMFDLKDLRNHRAYYYRISIEDKEITIQIFDKYTQWKVAEW